MLLTIRGVLSKDQLSPIQAFLEQADFQDGKLTAGGSAKPVKQNLQAVPTPDARPVEQTVLEALQANQPFLLGTRPKALVTPMFARYEPGMFYGRHLDNPLMGKATPVRTDISVTVFLDDGATYEGGELVIESDYGPFAFKGNAGDVIIYPATTQHHVAEVKSGVRHVALTWVQSMVRHSEQRRILFDLALLTNRLKNAPSEQRELAEKCHFNLFRMWAEP